MSRKIEKVRALAHCSRHGDWADIRLAFRRHGDGRHGALGRLFDDGGGSDWRRRPGGAGRDRRKRRRTSWRTGRLPGLPAASLGSGLPMSGDLRRAGGTELPQHGHAEGVVAPMWSRMGEVVRRVGVAGLLLRWRQAPGESALVPGHDDAAVPRVPVHGSRLPGQQRPLDRRRTDLHSLTRSG